MAVKKEQIRIRKERKPSKPAAASTASADTETEPAAPRRASRRSHKHRLWKRLLLVLLVAVLVFLLWKNWDTWNPKSAWEWLSVQITGGAKGDGYPYELEGSNVIGMKAVGNQLALLTDNALVMLNSTAGETVRRTHSFAQPLMETAGDYVLLGEIGGKRLRLETVHKTEQSVTLKNTVVTAALAKTGHFAVVTRASGSHMSEVVLYDKQGREQYHWYSADLLVTGVALREDGKQMAAVGVTAQDGACESRLMVFDVTDAAAEPQRYTGTDLLLCAVAYGGRSTVAAIGDEALWLVQPDQKEQTVVSYEARQLVQYGVSDRCVARVTRGYGSTSGGTLTVLDTSGMQRYEQVFDGNFRDMVVQKNDVWVLTDQALYRFDTIGNRTETAVSSDGKRMAVAFDRALVLGLTELRSYDIG